MIRGTGSGCDLKVYREGGLCGDGIVLCSGCAGGYANPRV